MEKYGLSNWKTRSAEDRDACHHEIGMSRKSAYSKDLTGQYFKLPNGIFGASLKPSAFKVFAYLVCGSEKFHPSHRQIASATDLNKRTVEESLRVLSAAGIIQASPYEKGIKQTYEIVPFRYWAKKSDPNEVGEKTPHSGQETYPQPGQRLPHIQEDQYLANAAGSKAGSDVVSETLTKALKVLRPLILNRKYYDLPHHLALLFEDNTPDFSLDELVNQLHRSFSGTKGEEIFRQILDQIKPVWEDLESERKEARRAVRTYALERLSRLDGKTERES